MDVFFLWQVVVEVEIFDVDGRHSSSWIGDCFVEEDFYSGKIGHFGCDVADVVDEVASYCHSHTVRVCFLLSKGCDDTDIGRFGAWW